VAGQSARLHRTHLAGAGGAPRRRAAAAVPTQGAAGRHAGDDWVRAARARSRRGRRAPAPCTCERLRQRPVPLGAGARAGRRSDALLCRRLPEGPRRAAAGPRALARRIAVALLANLGLGLQTALSAANLFYCLVGVFLGTLIGVLPGLGPTATIAMLLPITFALPPVSALIMLAGIYYGSQYGGCA